MQKEPINHLINSHMKTQTAHVPTFNNILDEVDELV